ncbi:MAG: competence/damage-inducible protein A [Planctomycetota bacterium]|nr:MAG: competence/damage-inducible protein A [Planctomycetota bacterium]
MKAVLLAIGDELLDGRTTDSNSVWIAGELLRLGIPVARKIICSDEIADLKAALGEACSYGQIVVSTGGLGPTEDDRTREVLAGFAGVELVHDEEAWSEIAAFYRGRSRQVPEANRRQALMPVGAERLSNPLGTAPGIALQLESGHRLFAIPGVPSEAKRMFTDQVAPRIRDLGTAMVQRTLAFAGVSESELGGRIAEFAMDGQDVRVGITANWGLIRVTARASGEGCEARMAPVLEEIRQRCAEWYLGEGRGELADFLVERLLARGEHIAFAESCTAGLACATLAQVPGVSAILESSFVTYADAAKQELLAVPQELLESEGAVSEACVRAMCEGLAARSGAELCLAISGIAGPGGGSEEKPVGLVYIGALYRGEFRCLKRRHGAIPRQQIRRRAVADSFVLGLQLSAS